jgi:hypothetical protein
VWAQPSCRTLAQVQALMPVTYIMNRNKATIVLPAFSQIEL